ncbi:PHO85 cyclin-7 [Leucoagaricus sp. SymC.cos]|nr:PHO85 cyclin-7 [Leucoagaricus sp. SymC.cos]
MLALVHPSSDVPHRNSSAAAVAAVTTQLPQRPQPAASSSRRSASSAASNTSEPPVLHRHQTAPSTTARISSSSSSRISRTHTPPLPRLPTSTPPPPPEPSSSTTLPPVDIHSYPTTDLLKLLASLLAQIASTNDQLATSVAASAGITTTSSTAPIHPNEDTPIWRSLTTASRSAISTPASTLTFHARNIPTITLEAYFLRILKYCPTTNEVFLALLVYFDRMSKLSADATARTFVIDSYNIHRLVIAGVTVASKFFSDVFYTNSRYAKVGGLPLPELNQLELQFLLLNDFRLVIASDEMQRYAEQLILFSRSSGVMTDGANVSTSTTSATSTTYAINGCSGATTVGSSGAAGVAAPMSAMGAIDAYGGRVADEPNYRTRKGITSSTASASSSSKMAPSSSRSGAMLVDSSTTPNSTLAPHNHHRHYRHNSATLTHSTAYEDEDAETEVGTEDGSTSGTTDDEPTIRAASVVSRGRRRESIDEAMGDAPPSTSTREDALTHTAHEEGERTPETQRPRAEVMMTTSP